MLRRTPTSSLPVSASHQIGKSGTDLLLAVAGLDVLMGDQLRRGTYLAYLPLAHILEFTFEMSALYLGVRCSAISHPQAFADSSLRFALATVP